MKPGPVTAEVRARSGPGSQATSPTRPSALYRSGFWRLGLTLTRILPYHLTARVLRSLARFYAASCPRRRGIVVKNLLPALNGNVAAAERMSRRVFEQFALKLADLWRFESGLPVEEMFTELSGWENFLEAQQRKRGVLLITPHLGNWEFGGPLLTKRGYKLQVITLAEPGRGFTELRKASRARWGIETLVIGENPFAIIDVIHRLEAGATVALLVDRPAESSAIEVELFGKPFLASCAAAELARASGCELLPVYLPRAGTGYAAHILPAIRYDRATLRSPEARQQLTQTVIAAFEPAIREHLDQWYHFVPVWPENR